MSAQSSAAPSSATSLRLDGSGFQLRGWPWLTALGLTVWMLFSLLLTRRAFRIHLAHFDRQSTLILVVVALTACVAVHILLRYAVIRKVMLPLMAGLPLLALLIFEPLAFVATSGLFLACYGLGRFLLERVGLAVDPGAQEIALSAGLGLALWTWGMFWLGLAHLYRAPVFLVLLLAACISFRREIQALWVSCRRFQATFVSVVAQGDATVSVALVFGVALSLMGLIVVLTPALDADFISFHFPLVRYYAAQHALTPLPTVDYTYYPQGLEVLMTFGHVLIGEAGDRMIPQVFFILLLLLMPSMARELGLSRRAAALGIAFVAALPFLHRTAVFGKNDLALALFQLSALVCYFRSREEPSGGWLRLGAVFLAASFAVKHVALFGAIPIAILYLRQLWRHPRPVREAAIVAVLFAAIALPWHVRTFAHTGNPLYPSGVRQATAVVETGDEAPAGRRKIGYFLIPLAVLFRGEHFFESASRNPLGVLFIVLLGLWLLVRRRPRSRAERVCLLFVLVYYLYWGAIWPVVRYAIVPIVLLALMTCGRLVAVRDLSGGYTRTLALSGWTYSLLFSLLVTLVLEVQPGMIGYLRGDLPDSQYLQAHAKRFPSVDYIARNAGPDDWTYSVWNCAAGFAPDPARFECSSPGRRQREDSVLDDLRKRPYRFLIVPTRGFSEEWMSDLTVEYELVRVHRDQAFTVYRFGPP